MYVKEKLPVIGIISVRYPHVLRVKLPSSSLHVTCYIVPVLDLVHCGTDTIPFQL